MKEFITDKAKRIKERVVYTRLIVLVFLIIGFLALLGPFLSVSFSASLSGPFGNESITYEDEEISSISLRNFADFSNVDDLVIFGERFGDYSIAGVNIHNLLKNPPKSGEYLTKSINALDVDALNYLSDEALEDTLNNIFPKYGDDIFNITSSVGNTLLEGRQMLISIRSIVLDASDVVNDASLVLNTVENVKTGLNVVTVIFLIVALIPIILVLIPKVSPKIARNFTIICSVLLLVFIATILITDSVLSVYIRNMVVDFNIYLNDRFTEIIDSVLADKAGFVSLLGGLNKDYFDFSLNLIPGWGLITSFIAYIGGIIAFHFIPKKDKNNDNSEEESVKEV